jgi:hypothetical protein
VLEGADDEVGVPGPACGSGPASMARTIKTDDDKQGADDERACQYGSLDGCLSADHECLHCWSDVTQRPVGNLRTDFTGPTRRRRSPPSSFDRCHMVSQSFSGGACSQKRPRAVAMVVCGTSAVAEPAHAGPTTLGPTRSGRPWQTHERAAGPLGRPASESRARSSPQSSHGDVVEGDVVRGRWPSRRGTI